MKKNYYLIFAFLLLFKVNAQIIDIKEESFKYALLLSNVENGIAKDEAGKQIKIDENDDSEIQLSEALKVSELDISSRSITSVEGIESFLNLKKLVCSGDNLSELKINSLNKLIYLDCSWNLFDSLDLSGLQNLETLVSAQGRLKSINIAGLSKLQNLHLNYNLLDNLNISGLESLKLMYVHNNNLNILDLTGITRLSDFICNDNNIESFKNLKDCGELTRLWVQNNQLNNLDLSNCSKLTDLWADNNKLTTIDLTTPKNIGNASLGNNKLTSITVENFSNIDFIRLSDNNFSTIDLSKFVKLTNVECKNNAQLTSIFLKNGKDEVIDIEGCTNLKYICNDDIKDSYVEKYLKYYNNTNVLLNTYCTFEPGGAFYTIKGNITFDLDNNGCDANDKKYPFMNFSTRSETQSGNLISNVTGEYDITLTAGAYKIIPTLEQGSYYKVTPEFLMVTFPNESSPYIHDFCVSPNGNHQDLEITILPFLPARPGFNAQYKLIYNNKGNQIKSGTVGLDFNDAVLDYVSSIPSISTHTTNKLVWNYENLQPFETREINVTLKVNSPMEFPAVNIDDRLSFNALILPVIDDEKPVDNSFAMRQTVVGSYDPNDKTCLEGDVVKPELIGEYVHYMIRFENTGTYPAENIVVKDMIDLSKFDISTLVPTKASHSFVTKISDGNKVEFIFEKINLPFNDANNDGYIAFKIKTLPTLVVGDTFTNEANIYFDYNYPILTNKASSIFKTLGTEDFEFSNYFNVHPNPAKDVLNISLKNDIEIESMSIYDILGQLLIAVPNAKNASSVDVSKLRTGNYLLKIKTEKGFSTAKFIKE